MKTVLKMPLAVGCMLDEDVGVGVTELASGERVDGGACFSWSCCVRLKNKYVADYLLWTDWLHSPW